MKIQCPACTTSFLASPKAIGSKGRRVRCARCGEEWHQAPAADAPAPDVIDAATPAPEPDVSPNDDTKVAKRAGNGTNTNAEDNTGERDAAPDSSGSSDSPDSFAESLAQVNADDSADSDATDGADSGAELLATLEEGDAEQGAGYGTASSDHQLPSLHTTRPPAPKGMMAFAACLLVAVMLGAGFVYYQSLRSVMPGLYAVLGAAESQGLELSKVDIQVLPGRRESRYFINGEIVNQSDAVRIIPGLRVTLRDEGGIALQYKDYNKEGTLAPGDSMPFQAKLRSKSSRVSDMIIEIGSPLEVALRN